MLKEMIGSGNKETVVKDDSVIPRKSEVETECLVFKKPVSSWKSSSSKKGFVVVVRTTTEWGTARIRSRRETEVFDSRGLLDLIGLETFLLFEAAGLPLTCATSGMAVGSCN